MLLLSAIQLVNLLIKEKEKLFREYSLNSLSLLGRCELLLLFFLRCLMVGWLF